MKILPLLLLLCAVTGCSSLSSRSLALEKQASPTLNFTAMTGEMRTGEEFRGKNMYVLFWATWCSNSRRALASFNRLAKANPGRGAFIAVNLDKAEDFSLVQARIREDEIDFVEHMFSGNDEQDDAYGALRGEVIPYVIVIDRKGTVQKVSTSVGDIDEFLD